MKKKIIAIGIAGLFLLVGLTSVSALTNEEGIKTSENSQEDIPITGLVISAEETPGTFWGDDYEEEGLRKVSGEYDNWLITIYDGGKIKIGAKTYSAPSDGEEGINQMLYLHIKVKKFIGYATCASPSIIFNGRRSPNPHHPYIYEIKGCGFGIEIEKSRERNLPFLNSLQQHPILFQLFQRFLKL